MKKIYTMTVQCGLVNFPPESCICLPWYKNSGYLFLLVIYHCQKSLLHDKWLAALVPSTTCFWVLKLSRDRVHLCCAALKTKIKSWRQKLSCFPSRDGDERFPHSLTARRALTCSPLHSAAPQQPHWSYDVYHSEGKVKKGIFHLSMKYVNRLVSFFPQEQLKLVWWNFNLGIVFFLQTCPEVKITERETQKTLLKQLFPLSCKYWCSKIISLASRKSFMSSVNKSNNED